LQHGASGKSTCRSKQNSTCTSKDGKRCKLENQHAQVKNQPLQQTAIKYKTSIKLHAALQHGKNNQ